MKKKERSVNIPTIEEVENEQKRLRHRAVYQRTLRGTIAVLLVVAAVSVLVATLWMPVLQIYGSSMSPTLEAGQIVVSVRTNQLKTGEVVAFWQGNKLLVKRVIAGPGQWVDIDMDGNVTVDGKELTEDYLDVKALGNCDVDLPHELFELSYNGNRDGFDNGEHNGRFNDMFIKAKKDIELGENQNLYIIVRTEPLDLPEEYREPKRYENRLFIIDSGKSENEQRAMGSAEQRLYNGGDILKELGQTFEYDRTDGTNGTVKVIEPGKDKGDTSRICTNLLTSGVYAAWAFKVNYTGELQGTYRVLEEIPDGMELAYIRIKWHGNAARNIVSKDITELGKEWKRERNLTTTDRQESDQETIYYVNKNGKQALIELGEFIAGKIVDDYSVDVQVVCRVTDKKVLLGGEQKTFTNKVTLQNADGTKNISTATATATFSDKNLTKKNNLTGESNYTMSAPNTSQRLTYTITANARGQQLLTGDGEKLTIVDKLGDNLSLVGDSFKAKDLQNNTSVNIKTKYDPKTKIIEIEIPDKTPVEITYEARTNRSKLQKKQQ